MPFHLENHRKPTVLKGRNFRYLEDPDIQYVNIEKHQDTHILYYFIIPLHQLPESKSFCCFNLESRVPETLVFCITFVMKKIIPVPSFSHVTSHLSNSNSTVKSKNTNKPCKCTGTTNAKGALPFRKLPNMLSDSHLKTFSWRTNRRLVKATSTEGGFRKIQAVGNAAWEILEWTNSIKAWGADGFSCNLCCVFQWLYIINQ